MNFTQISPSLKLRISIPPSSSPRFFEICWPIGGLPCRKKSLIDTCDVHFIKRTGVSAQPTGFLSPQWRKTLNEFSFKPINIINPAKRVNNFLRQSADPSSRTNWPWPLPAMPRSPVKPATRRPSSARITNAAPAATTRWSSFRCRYGGCNRPITGANEYAKLGQCWWRYPLVWNRRKSRLKGGGLAQDAVITAQQTGRSLLDVLMWYTTVGRAIKEAPTLDICRVEYLRMKALVGARPPSLKGHRVGLARFCERFGRRKPFEVTSDDIARFLGQWELSTTRASCGRRLYGFFAWLVTQGFTAQNPLQLLPQPEYRAGSKDIYQADEVRDILGRTWQTDQLGYWVLALYGVSFNP